MSLAKLANRKISQAVKSKLESKGWSIRECVEAYNERFSNEIVKGLVKPMNKDFIQRLKSNKFEVANQRVKDFCNFLDIDAFYIESDNFQVLNEKAGLDREFRVIEELILKNPSLEGNIKSILKDISNIIAIKGA